jgi:hypothetical protein
MAPQLTDRDATLSARRVCCPCSGHMSTSVFVIDRVHARQQSPTRGNADVAATRSRSTQLWAYCARVGKTRIQMQGFRKFPKAPDPESRKNRNIAGGQKTSRFDFQYH